MSKLKVVILYKTKKHHDYFFQKEEIPTNTTVHKTKKVSIIVFTSEKQHVQMKLQHGQLSVFKLF